MPASKTPSLDLTSSESASFRRKQFKTSSLIAKNGIGLFCLSFSSLVQKGKIRAPYCHPHCQQSEGKETEAGGEGDGSGKGNIRYLSAAAGGSQARGPKGQLADVRHQTAGSALLGEHLTLTGLRSRKPNSWISKRLDKDSIKTAFLKFVF